MFLPTPRISAYDIYAVVPKMTHFSNTQMPTKVFDGMAMAKPVLASKASDLGLILGKSGVLVKAGDVDGIADAILRLSSDEKM